MPANRSAGSAARQHKREHRSDIPAISDRAGSPQSGSNEAFWLTNIIPGVIQNNPSLTENIYLRLYSYDEESEETISLGDASEHDSRAYEGRIFRQLFMD
jgi:hypothetical protein